MRYLILVVLCAVILGGCAKRDWNKRAKTEVGAIIQSKYGCTDLEWLHIGEWRAVNAAHVSVNACGTVRVFAHGKWCDECTRSWREIKKESQ